MPIYDKRSAIKEKEGEIDPFYGSPIGSRRLEIQKLRFKLQKKISALVGKIHDKYKEKFERARSCSFKRCKSRKTIYSNFSKGLFEAINVDHELDFLSYIRQLNEQGYFDLLSHSQGEHNQVDESPLTRNLYNDFSELCDRSDHENMLEATDSWFSSYSNDPVISGVLGESVFGLNVPGNTKRERKKARHRSDIYRRRLGKHVYERYLSEAVGKPITVEEYEREFGFLSGVNEKSSKTTK